MRMRLKRRSSRSKDGCAPSLEALPPPSGLWRGGRPPPSSTTALGRAHSMGTVESGCHHRGAHRHTRPSHVLKAGTALEAGALDHTSIEWLEAVSSTCSDTCSLRRNSLVLLLHGGASSCSGCTANVGAHSVWVVARCSELGEALMRAARHTIGLPMASMRSGRGASRSPVTLLVVSWCGGVGRSSARRVVIGIWAGRGGGRRARGGRCGRHSDAQSSSCRSGPSLVFCALGLVLRGRSARVGFVHSGGQASALSCGAGGRPVARSPLLGVNIR